MKLNSAIIFAVCLLLIFSGCSANSQNNIANNEFRAEDSVYSLKGSTYQDFLDDGWQVISENIEPTIQKIETDTLTFYRIIVKISKNNTVLSEATFISYDPLAEFGSWELISVVANYEDNGGNLDNITIPVNCLSLQTLDDLKSFLITNEYPLKQILYRDSGDKALGTVIDGYYMGVRFSETGKRLSASFEVEELSSGTRTISTYKRPINSSEIKTENAVYHLNRTTYQDFLDDGWQVISTYTEPGIYKIETETHTSYQFSVKFSKNNTVISEATFKSDDPSAELASWKLISAVSNYADNGGTLDNIFVSKDFLSLQTPDDIEAFLAVNEHKIIQIKNQNNGDTTIGTVIDGCYIGIMFSETGERISAIWKVDEPSNGPRTISIYKHPIGGDESGNTESGKSDFVKIEERHCFTYKGVTYVVGKHKLNDFLEDGWELHSQFPADFEAEPNTMYDVEYLKRDQVFIGPLFFVNGNDTETKLLKDCTLISCTIPINFGSEIPYDNSEVILPYGLDATMNGEDIINLYNNIGDYECYAYEVDDGIMLALGIVSPYNSQVVMSDDQTKILYIFMEVNVFYAGDY